MNHNPPTNALSNWLLVGVATAMVSLGCHRSDPPDEPRVNTPEPVPSVVAESAEQTAADTPSPPQDDNVPHTAMPDGFVGTDACAECHRERHDSYLLTGHSRSLRLPEADDLPTGLAFHHPPSKRSYSVMQDAKRWVHREERFFGDAPESDDRLPVAQLPVEYVLGSGALAKAYLVRDGDYLLQSPVTWHTARNAYDIAPGYDSPTQRGFSRIVDDNCVYCHAGLIEIEEGNPNKFAIHELAIGCERCHGAGAEHVRLHQTHNVATLASPSETPTASANGAAGTSESIVNPMKLGRDQSEAICAQCHLDSDVIVHAIDATRWDFHPGDSLASNRLAYQAVSAKQGEGEAAAKKGSSNHFDQLWQSSCYLNSETLTCTTCHDPHAPAPSADRLAALRETCNRCHEDHRCGLPLEQREQTHQNACTSCHMPRSADGVPHAGVTNHLIAIYRDGQPNDITSESSGSMRRVARSTVPLTEMQLKRRDVLAEANWAVIESLKGNDEPILELDQTDLKRLADSGDIESMAVMAETARHKAETLSRQSDNEPPFDLNHRIERQRGFSHYYAVKTLRQETGPSKRRQNALETLADKLMVDQAFDQSIPLWEELTRIRRDVRDWHNLALCYAGVKRIADAEAALQTAIQIDPAYANAYASLANIYSYIDESTAAQFDRLYRRLTE